MKKRITKEIAYKHKDGSIFEGFRVIEGSSKIRQIIVYQEKYITDDATYSKDQESLMESVALQIMSQFANGHTLSAREYRQNVKF